MDLRKKSFDKLAKKLETLQENQKGELKGGFYSVPPKSWDGRSDGNGLFCMCTEKPKSPSQPAPQQG